MVAAVAVGAGARACGRAGGQAELGRAQAEIERQKAYIRRLESRLLEDPLSSSGVEAAVEVALDGAPGAPPPSAGGGGGAAPVGEVVAMAGAAGGEGGGAGEDEPGLRRRARGKKK